jgi:hypothetical protein
MALGCGCGDIRPGGQLACATEYGGPGSIGGGIQLSMIGDGGITPIPTNTAASPTNNALAGRSNMFTSVAFFLGSESLERLASASATRLSAPSQRADCFRPHLMRPSTFRGDEVR